MSAEVVYREKMPSKALDALEDRFCVLQEKLHARMAREYPIGALCQFRPGAHPEQLHGRITGYNGILVKVLRVVEQSLCQGPQQYAYEICMLDVRRLDTRHLKGMPV